MRGGGGGGRSTPPPDTKRGHRHGKKSCVTNVFLLAGKMGEVASGVTPVNPKFRSGLLAMSCALGWSDGPSRDDFYINHALKVC